MFSFTVKVKQFLYMFACIAANTQPQESVSSCLHNLQCSVGGRRRTARLAGDLLVVHY